MIEMSLSGSGIRDIARVLKVSLTTVIKELKKKKPWININPDKIEIEIHKVEDDDEEGELFDVLRVKESQVDEMWSFVGNQKNPRKLWHALD